MSRFYADALAELESLRVELSEIEAAADEDVCRLYRVDRKPEIVQLIAEEIESLEREVEYLAPATFEVACNY